MHEGMHMTQMQFMNTGAREIVPFLDTTFGQHGAQRMYLRRRHGPSVGLTK